MAEIRPFKGLLYNGTTDGVDLSEVVAPPYDVISDDMRERLYGKSPYNIVRLILAKENDRDDAGNNKYTRAKGLLGEWKDKGILSGDDDPAIYVYRQEYDHDGAGHIRTGFLAVMRIVDPGTDTILPHEHTLAKPKEDRLKLIEQVKGNLSPIFTLFEDDGTVEKTLKKAMSLSGPVVDIKVDGERHELWRMTDPEDIKAITSYMKDRKVFIADGHHRYEVARMYRNIRRNDPGYDGSADFIMMYFADMSDEDNLTVMGTHRVIKDVPFNDPEDMKRLLEGYFDLKNCKDLTDLKEKMKENEDERNVFGLFTGGEYILMVPRDPDRIMDLIDEDRSEDWKRLDVSALHYAVFHKMLSLRDGEGNIIYVKLHEEAESLVRDGKGTMAFFVNPTKVSQLKAVAQNGDMMPQKSTYFYPKLLTGLVIHNFEQTGSGVPVEGS